jgi:hypothetical protein
MANHKHTSSQKLEFFNRVSKIEKLPKDFVKKILTIDPNLSVNRIENVRYGRTIDFYILGLLEDLAEVPTTSKAA